MKNRDSVILGTILVIIGLILAGKTLGIINVNIFFKGWWTLFIIIPCLIGLINDKDKTGSVIGLIIGILLLLACYNIINFELIWSLIFPIIIIALGLSLIFKNSFNEKIDKEIKDLNIKKNNDNNYFATFSGQNISLDNEVFKGTELNAIFGSIKLDLRKAKIKDNVIINAFSIFGGIELLVPDDAKIKIKSNSFFGGVSNDRKNEEAKDGDTIYVIATCLFGGVTIK